MIRRRFPGWLGVVAALLAALVLTGCSGSSGGSESTAATGDAPATGAYPVTVSTENGDVVISKPPERIVTLGNPAFENVVALGVQPVAATVTNAENLPYLAAHVRGDTIDESMANIYANEINFERILTHRPDLIVVPAWPVFTAKSTVERLRSIAPTLVFDTQTANNDWRVGVQQVADALGRSDNGKQLIAAALREFERVGAARPGLPAKPYSFGLYFKEEITLASGGNVLRLFGMTPAEDQAGVEDQGGRVAYSGENAGAVDGAIVLLLPSPRSGTASLEATPAWRGNLESRVIWLSDAQGEAINNAGILGKTWLPGDLDRALAAIAG